jgi:hypothetical protein
MNSRIGTLAIMACVIVATVWGIHHTVIDNYFTWDDFVWLQKAKSLPATPGQIFQIDVIYFDPLVHLSFWLDYAIAGLNYRWYHIVDLLTHGINGLLVYLVAEAMSRNRTTAVIAALVFVSSFVTVDAVAWSSSRVDLLATLFSLASLLLFIRFLEFRRPLLFWGSTVCFVLALGAKGTPVILPLLLGGLLLQNKAPLRDYRFMLPHTLLVGAYFTLLKSGLTGLGKQLTAGGGFSPNLHNLKLALGSLFVPETGLAAMNPTVVSLVVACLLAASLFVRLPGGDERTKRFGLALMVAGILPTLILKDFNLATSIDNAVSLLTSPSHRVYLASTGQALFVGAMIAGLLQRHVAGAPRNRLIGAGIILVPLLFWNAGVARQREQLWHASGEYTRHFVEGFKPFRGILVSNTLLATVNPPMSRGFVNPALDVFYGVNNLTLLPLKSVPEQIIDSPDIFPFLNRALLFVYGQDRLYDFSAEFRELINISFQYATTGNEADRPRLLAAYAVKVGQLNGAIRAAQQQEPSRN